MPFLPGKGKYKRVDVLLYMNNIKKWQREEKTQKNGIKRILWEQKCFRG